MLIPKLITSDAFVFLRLNLLCTELWETGFLACHIIPKTSLSMSLFVPDGGDCWQQ